MLIYKILRTPEWEALQANGATPGAPIDIADGYVHFSTAKQARETAKRHFKGETGLHLAAYDANQLGAALKWEPSRGGDMFPHLYGPLRLSDMLWCKALPLTDIGHRFPEDMV